MKFQFGAPVAAVLAKFSTWQEVRWDSEKLVSVDTGESVGDDRKVEVVLNFMEEGDRRRIYRKPLKLGEGPILQGGYAGALRR